MRRLLREDSVSDDKITWLRLPDFQYLSNKVQQYYLSISDSRIFNVSIRDAENGRENRNAKRTFSDREDELRAQGNIQTIVLYFAFETSDNFHTITIDCNFDKLDTLEKVFTRLILEIDNYILLSGNTLTLEHFKFYSIPLKAGEQFIDTKNLMAVYVD